MNDVEKNDEREHVSSAEPHVSVLHSKGAKEGRRRKNYATKARERGMDASAGEDC